jgi:O-antigen/teichoic acid export membrane protein
MKVLDRIRVKWVAAHKSELEQTVKKNIVWNSLDYVVLPAALLVLTPFFVHRLGSEQFGIWVLANALAGLTGVFGLGLAGATIKFVSAYHARADMLSVERVVASTLTVYGLLGIVTCLVVSLTASFLVGHVFRVGAANVPIAIVSTRLAGLCFSVRMFQEVLQATVQGCHRYDVSARIGMSTKCAILAASALLVLWHQGVVQILSATVIVSGLSSVAFGLAARKLIPGLRFYPSLNIVSLREVFGFGFYSWLQNLAGTVFAQADVFLVGTLLGPGAVTIYSVCQRLAMQIHSLLSAASAFLFPLSSAARERQDLNLLESISSRALSIGAIAASALGITLFVFSRSILTLWMGPGFASSGTELLKILALAYALLAMSIVPYQVLNGSGYVKENTLLGWLSVATTLVSTILLVPAMGLLGVGWAKLANLGPLLISVWYVQRKVLGCPSWRGVLLPFVTILVAFAAVGVVIAEFGDPHLSSLVGLGLANCLCLILAIVGITVLHRLFGSALGWTPRI